MAESSVQNCCHSDLTYCLNSPIQKVRVGQNKTEAPSTTGVFAGYELAPGCRWTGLYHACCLAEFVESDVVIFQCQLSRKQRRVNRVGMVELTRRRTLFVHLKLNMTD